MSSSSPPVRRWRDDLARRGLILAVSAILTLAVLPFAWLLGSAVYGLRVALHAGHWPDRGAFEAGSLEGFETGTQWAEHLVALSFFGVSVTVALWTITRFLPRRWWIAAAVAILVAGWAVTHLLVAVDPLGLVGSVID